MNIQSIEFKFGKILFLTSKLVSEHNLFIIVPSISFGSRPVMLDTSCYYYFSVKRSCDLLLFLDDVRILQQDMRGAKTSNPIIIILLSFKTECLFTFE